MTIPEATVGEFNYVEGEKSYRVLVLKQELNPMLPNFVGYMIDRQVLMICETVPEKYRDYILGHEILCRVDYRGQKGGCLRATTEEYGRVPDHIKAEYAIFRLEFYRHLISFYSSKETEPGFMDEISASLAFWEETVAAT